MSTYAQGNAGQMTEQGELWIDEKETKRQEKVHDKHVKYLVSRTGRNDTEAACFMDKSRKSFGGDTFRSMVQSDDGSARFYKFIDDMVEEVAA